MSEYRDLLKVALAAIQRAEILRQGRVDFGDVEHRLWIELAKDMGAAGSPEPVGTLVAKSAARELGIEDDSMRAKVRRASGVVGFVQEVNGRREVLVFSSWLVSERARRLRADGGSGAA